MNEEFDTKYELEAFQGLLNMDNENLRWIVDLYNAGSLSPEAMRALEAIEAMGGENE